MEHVVVDGPQWGIEFDEPLYSLKDWGSVSSYIDHGDGDDSDAGVNGATSAPRDGSGKNSPLKGAVFPRSGDGNGVAEARASAEAAGDPDDGSNDCSGSGSFGFGHILKAGGSEGAHDANCDENGARGDVNGLCRSSNSNQADGAEQDVNFDSGTNQHDRSDGEIDSIQDDLAKGAEQDVDFGSKANEDGNDDSIREDRKGVNCAEGSEQDVKFDSKTNEHDRSADKGVDCAEGAEQDVNIDSKTNEHDREDDLKGVNWAEGAEQDVNFDSKTNEHDRSHENALKGVNCAEGAEQDVNFDSKTNEHACSDDSIRDDLNGAEGAEGGREVNFNSEHDRQSDGTSEPRICAQTGNDDIRGERIVDSQKDEVIPDTEEAGEHNGFSEDGFLSPKPLKVAPPPRKRARIQQKEKKEKEKGKEKEKKEQAKKQKAKGKKEKEKVEKDEEECDTYQCEICKKKFKHSWRLREHRIVHSNEKQFVCNFPGCDSKYKRKSDLNIHMRLH